MPFEPVPPPVPVRVPSSSRPGREPAGADVVRVPLRLPGAGRSVVGEAGPAPVSHAGAAAVTLVAMLSSVLLSRPTFLRASLAVRLESMVGCQMPKTWACDRAISGVERMQHYAAVDTTEGEYWQCRCKEFVDLG